MASRIPTLETHEDSLKDSMKETAGLVAACKAGDSGELRTILDQVKKRRGDSDQLLNHKSFYQDGTTPLHVACCHGNVDCIKLLLDNGADANVYDVRGFTSIHCAACNNHTNAIDALLNFSPQDSHIMPPCKVDQRSEYDETPLHIACLMGNYGVVKFLLGRNAELELEDGEGNNFLHFISASDDALLWGWAVETVNNTSSLGHLVDKRNLHGQTPAHRAASLGCVMSISALFVLKAKFELRDLQNRSAINVLHQYGNVQCYMIATGQQPPKPIPSSPMPSRAEMLPPQRTLSGGSSSSPKPLVRRPSITGRKRPATVAISLPPSATASAQMMHLRRNSLRSVHTRSSSMDDYLNLSLSKDDLNKLSRLNSATASEETIQMVLDNSAYNPPLDLNVVEPVLNDLITPTNSTIYCKEHAIKVTTNYFNSKTKPAKASASNPPPALETEIPVCIAAAMHLHISFPSDYTIISPVCFISCRCEHTCRATLELPHAASISAGRRDKEEQSLFCVLSFVTFDLKRSTQVESPSPILERRLEPLVLKSLEVESNLVRFKTTLGNPCLYAVGIRNDTSRVPRPLAPLRCALFCLYKKFEDQVSVSVIPIKMYVGLNLRTVTEIMKSEAHGTGCDIHDLLFKLSGEGVLLKSSLDNSEDQWVLDIGQPQKLSYSQIALTEDIITGNVSYSHSLSYPPHKLVRVLPGTGNVAVRFLLSVMDYASSVIGRTSFVPFAPMKSTTATPNPSPPPNHSHRRFITPDPPGPISPVVTITSSSPPLLQSTQAPSGGVANGVRGNGTVVPNHTAIPAAPTHTAPSNGTVVPNHAAMPVVPNNGTVVPTNHMSTSTDGPMNNMSTHTSPSNSTVVTSNVTTSVAAPSNGTVVTNHAATTTHNSRTKLVNGVELEVSMV